MKTLTLVLPYLLTLVVGHGTQAASQTPAAADSENKAPANREPASSVETKKGIATEGLPQSEEEPTRLWKSPWRKSMEDTGFSFDAFLFWDGISNQSGGAKQGAAGFSTFDLLMRLDLEKSMKLEGYSTFIHYHAHSGQPIDDYPGDFMGINAYAMPTLDSLISQAYLKKEDTDGGWSLLLGLYDFSTEFFYTDTSMIFLNNGFTVGAEAYPPQPYGLSIYPINGPSLRFRKVFSNSLYLMAGASSGVPRDGNFTQGTHPRAGNDEGIYQIVETGLQQEISKAVFNKYFIGYWWMNKKSNSLKDETQSDFSKGFYLMADQHLTDETSCFVRWGVANEKVSEIINSLALGVKRLKIFSENDQLGLGYAFSTLNSATLDAREADGIPTAPTEAVIEVLYRNEIIPGFTLMPDWQTIINPSMNKNLKPASVFSFHIEMSI